MIPGSRLRADLPLVGDAPDPGNKDFKLFNKISLTNQRGQQDKTQTQNHPMMENQNTNGTPKGLPLVGIGVQKLKERNAAGPSPIPPDFKIILYWKSKPHFRIILRLENAPGGPPHKPSQVCSSL